MPKNSSNSTPSHSAIPSSHPNNLKTKITQLIRKELEQIKIKKEPSLFTHISFGHKSFGQVRFSSSEIIDITREIVSEKFKLVEKNANIKFNRQSATTQNPYIIDSIDKFLAVVLYLEKPRYQRVSNQIDGKDYIFCKICETVFMINTETRYSSYSGKKGDLLEEVKQIGLQMISDFFKKNVIIVFSKYFPEILDIKKNIPLNKFLLIISALSKQLDQKLQFPSDELTDIPYHKIAEIQKSEMVTNVSSLADMTVKTTIENFDITRLSSIIQEIKSDQNKLIKILLDFSHSFLNIDVKKIIDKLITEKELIDKSHSKNEKDRIEKNSDKLMTDFHNQLKLKLFGNHFKDLDNLKHGILGSENFITEILSKLDEIDQIIEKEINEPSITKEDEKNLLEFIDVLFINQLRSILNNEYKKPSHNLLVTLSALLISETSRCRDSFPASLMLFDLIEGNKESPHTNEIFSWLNCLQNSQDRHEFIDNYGRWVSQAEVCSCTICQEYQKNKEDFIKKIERKIGYESKKNINSFNNDYLFRMINEVIDEIFEKDYFNIAFEAMKINRHSNTQIKCKDFLASIIYFPPVPPLRCKNPGGVNYWVSGHHPMVQKFSSRNFMLLSHQKIASIVMQWLKMQLEGSSLEINLERSFSDLQTASKQNVTNFEQQSRITNLVKALLKRRLSDFNYLSSYDDTVQKIIQDGCLKLGIPFLKINKPEIPCFPSGDSTATSKVTMPKRVVELLDGKEISLDYWYEDSDMNHILRAQISKYNYLTSADIQIHVLGPLDNISLYGLVEALDEHKRKPGVVLIPFNLGLLHWVGLALEYDVKGNLIKANYYDSLESDIPDYLNHTLETLCGVNDVKAFTVFKKTDGLILQEGNDCGACTIENLLCDIGYREPKETDAVSRRLRHLKLLEDAEDTKFYTAFYERQRLNQPSFRNIPSAAKLNEKILPDAGKPIAFSITEYAKLLQLALRILELPQNIQEQMKNALQLNETVKSEEHVSCLARMRTVLSGFINDEAVKPIIESFFYLSKDTNTLENSPLKIDYNQISSLSILLSLPAKEIQEDIKIINSKTLREKCYFWLSTTNKKLSISISSKNLEVFLRSGNKGGDINIFNSEKEAEKKLEAKFKTNSIKKGGICKGFIFELNISQKTCSNLFKNRNFDVIVENINFIKQYSRDINSAMKLDEKPEYKALEMNVHAVKI